MVSIQRNVNILSLPSVDDPVVKQVLQQYARDCDMNSGEHFDLDGVLDALLDAHTDAIPDDQPDIHDQIVALQSFMTTHNLELSDLVWYWW